MIDVTGSQGPRNVLGLDRIAHLRECAFGENTANQGGQPSVTHNFDTVGSGLDTNINKQVFPQAPSPTMTSLRRISAMTAAADLVRESDSKTAMRKEMALQQVELRWDGLNCWCRDESEEV